MQRHTDPVQYCLSYLRGIFLLLLVIIILMLAGKALAQEHSHAGHDKLHHWYSKLMRPDVPNSSCCSNRDCTQVQARFSAKGWEFLKGSRWVVVPPEKINKEESFDTQAHACWTPWTTDTDEPILCFVMPGAGL